MKVVEIFWAQNAGVGFGVVRVHPIAVDERECGAQNDRAGSPPRAIFPRYSGRCGEAYGKKMEEMREEERRQSVVEVGVWFIGDAEWTVRKDVGAIGQVEASGIEGGETGSKPQVRFSEGGAWAHQAETGEEHVIRGLQSRGCDGENIFW